MNIRGPVILARYLGLAWLALVIYGTLYPFTGWRDTGASPWAFIDGGWPRYWTFFDLIANVAVYLPIGLFFTLGLMSLRWHWLAAALAIFLACGVSFLLESVQTWLPTRVPSNIDLACNSLGGLLGSVLALWAGPRLLAKVAAWEHRIVAPVTHAEFGLTLIGLWFFIPVSPEIMLFGAGDFRQAFGLTGALPFEAQQFAQLESAVIACNLVAFGLIARWLIARRLDAYLIVPTLIFFGLLIRTLSAAILVDAGEAFAWLTPTVQLGITAGLAALAVLMLLPPVIQLPCAALAVLAGTVIVNMAPHNPYSAAARAAWRQGHFLNFNGLTRWLSMLWPFLALPFLFVTRRQP